MTDAERRRMVMVHNERCRAAVNACVGGSVGVLLAVGIGDGRFALAENPPAGAAETLGIGVFLSIFCLVLAYLVADGLRVEP
jgi:hypothetical protein